jgi:hypothetical protein
MQRIGPIVKPSNTLEETVERVAQAPALRAYLAALTRSGRSKLRGRLQDRGYSQEQVEAIIPSSKGGRPAKAPAGTFEGLSEPVRSAIADALGMNAFPTEFLDWNDEETASAAADAVVDHYDNPTTITTKLTMLRNGLKALGVPEAVWRATLRPDITRVHNERGEARRAERAAEGLQVPEPFRRIADLRARVEALIDRPGEVGYPDGQAAADLLVVLSARPGEAETLTIGERGGVRGALKKRGVERAYNLVSALGPDTARRFLALWQATPLPARTRAMRDLGALVRAWGIQKRDLRAIGAALAERAAVLAGAVANPAQGRDVQRAALRHAEPARREAVDHYARVNDPVARLCAQLAELSVEDLARVQAVVDGSD